MQSIPLLRTLLLTLPIALAAGCDDDKTEADEDRCDLAPELCADGGEGSAGESDGDPEGSGGSTSGGSGSTGGGSGSGTGGSTSGGTSGSGGEVDPDSAIEGQAVVFIGELGCDLVWDMSGTHCAGCDLGWDVDLDDTGRGSCSFGASTSGTFSLSSNAAYFNTDYWGEATYAEGDVRWETNGYVYGAGGYSYIYLGSASYSGGGGSGTGGSGEDGSGTDGSGTGSSGDSPVDPESSITGQAQVWILEADCDIVWSMTGDPCETCDLGWDVDLRDASGSCDVSSDVDGLLELHRSATYFDGMYWGATTYRDGYFAWSTYGYIYGAGGGSYHYSGYGYWE